MVIPIKSESELALMIEGGKRLKFIKEELEKKVKEGVSAKEIEELAADLIDQSEGRASFKSVPNYYWATCVNRNEGLVHGIPTKDVIFKKGDVVSVDIGLYYQGFHTDTSFSVGIKPDRKIKEFLQAGKEALDGAIKKVHDGSRIYDLSEAIQSVIEQKGYTPIRALFGHGVGRQLHEKPFIPCFVPEAKKPQELRKKSPEIKPGMVLAIEVMYTMGAPEIKLAKDGWTISVADGKISALYEETVALTKHGRLVLTG